MNLYGINGAEVNGGGVAGNNATLAGGVAVAALFSALLVSGAVLAGGLESTPEAGGRVSQHLSGGATNTSAVDAKWFITTVLREGIYSGEIVSSNLGRAPGLQDGIYSPSDYGGQLIAEAKLQTADTVGFNSEVGGNIIGSTILVSDIYGTNYVGGNIIGSTVLLADGLKSTSVADGNIYTGRIITGGVSSSASLDGRYFITARPYGGILNFHSVGHEVDISPMLQDGLIQLNEMHGAIVSGAMLHDGNWSRTQFEAGIRISPSFGGGWESGQQLSALAAVGAMLTGGSSSACFIDSMQINASQVLVGGITSSCQINALLMAGARLQDGVSASGAPGGNSIISAMLTGSNLSGCATDSGLLIEAVLMGGVTSLAALNGEIKTQIFLPDGVSSTYSFDSQILSSPTLAGGVESASSALGGDIAEMLEDPLLNTWALEIVSATEVLEIVTPEGDI